MLGPFLGRWSALRWSETASEGYKKAFGGAVDELAKDDATRRALLDAGNANEQASEAVENEEAALQRFANLYEHLAEANHLRAHGEAEIKAQFERLWKAEQSVLPLAAPRYTALHVD